MQIQPLIIEAIKYNLNRFKTHFNPTPTLINSVKFILDQFYIEKKRFVIGTLPTGSGKTIIGFMTHFCCEYIERSLNGENARDHDEREPFSYFLTSNKILQDQIENDIDRFQFGDSFIQLKGVNNYPCIVSQQKFDTDAMFRQRLLTDNPDMKFVTYEYRDCMGESSQEVSQRECYLQCQYKQLRNMATEANCVVLNYSYFLNVMRSEFNPYFSQRALTICDEAHLMPGIVTNMFNVTLSMYNFSVLEKFIQTISNFVSTETQVYFNNIMKYISEFFMKKLGAYDSGKVKNLYTTIGMLVETLKGLRKENKNNPMFSQMFLQALNKQIDKFTEIQAAGEYIVDLFKNSPDDIFIEKELINGYYRFIIRDLSEHRLVQKHFLSKTKKVLFMSATFGEETSFAEMCGLNPSEYTYFRIKSTFDFSRSPIYILKAGNLSYKTFDNNIANVLRTCLLLCNKHSKERGVIHTGTFKITDLLMTHILKYDDGNLRDRCIWYNNSDEKEQAIETLKNSENGILIGPSLYEGLDLKDDLCRFQLLVKVPYVSLTEYIKLKMNRYPSWYQNDCKQKIIQAIGRSNRHVNDYSTIYLLDSMFERVIFDLNDDIIGRLKYK